MQKCGNVTIAVDIVNALSPPCSCDGDAEPTKLGRLTSATAFAKSAAVVEGDGGLMQVHLSTTQHLAAAYWKKCLQLWLNLS